MVSKALILDVGGVLLVPNPDLVGQALRGAKVDFDDGRLAAAHYYAIHHLDDDDVPLLDHPSEYDIGFLSYLGIEDSDFDPALAAFAELGRIPAIESWTSPVPGAAGALASLCSMGTRIAIVSNSDGTVEESLKRREICQVGDGPLPEVAAIVDSTVAGVAKPDPRIFLPALAALGASPSDALYVGDSERFDVRSAEQAGIRPIHFDPFGLCRNPTAHAHVNALADVRRLLSNPV
jgi:putative hydrolase of the HAD superfamily